MAETYIFTSLVVPATTNGPSLSTLQWSEDGQAFILTRGTVYILTPSTGITFDISSVLTAFPAYPTKNRVKEGEALSWYRTMIELEKTVIHHWPFESQEWGTVSLGVLDMSWNSITISPTNLSKESCCMMVGLNTNLEVSLWAPYKNYLTGEWFKVQDVTQAIKEYKTARSSGVQRTLNAQVQCISWSQQVDFGEGMRFIDGSLLALGNRAGCIIFMQLHQIDVSQVLQPLATLEVADDWITSIAWSSWRKIGPSHFQASLACGVPDGCIIIVSVSLLLDSNPWQPETLPRFEFVLENDGQSCCPADGSAITALTWINSKVHAPILAYTKPGVVHLKAQPSDLSLGWDGSRALVLQSQPMSSNSTPFAATSGLLYYERKDTLLVCLFDGSFYTISGVSTSPTLDASSHGLTSEDLSSQARIVFSVTEGKISSADANQTSGVFDYDGAGCIGWLHEKCRPHDFSYKHDAKHDNIFVVTQLWRDEAFILEQLASQLGQTANSDAAPLHVLRGAFLYLRNTEFLETHQNHIIDLLEQRKTTNEAALPFSNPGSSLVPVSRLGFRHALSANLFRRHNIRSLQLALGIAKCCSQVRGVPCARFDKLVDELSGNILCFQLQAVLCQIDRFRVLLEDDDRSFIRRWVTHCLAQPSAPLQQEAIAVATRAGISADSLLENLDIQEQCPACHVVIPIENGKSAVCLNGHTWARCSVTLFILATASVRTCVGCCRKAFLPLSQRDSSESDGLSWQPSAANSWLVQELLEAACWCTFCGNRFVRVL